MPDSLSIGVRKFADRATRRANEVLRESIRLLYVEVVSNAPQLSGYLRASVKASKGAPLPIEAAPPPAGGTYTYDPTAALAAIADAKAGEAVFLSVTASYALFVEYGTSRQASNAFFRRAAMRWGAIVEQANVNVSRQ
ncbi:hypothetical protein [Methylobacterium indicum]|uniref:hypothetical protein n=1 Tax=Methylobacterium indicum TaxID=1775910 RepID=UPI001A92C599|nr:hypothetical protein [Methylobacterium indicum]